MRPLAIPLALTLALCACHHSSQNPPPPEPVVLEAGPGTLTFGDGGTIVLARGEQTALTLDASSFQLGLVNAPLNLRNDSYDPYWLEPANLDGGSVVPAGTRFESAQSVSVSSATSDTVVLSLAYPSGTATLTIKAEAPGRFSASWVPKVTDAQSALAWLRLRPHVDPNEQFYGLGEWGDTVAHRGTQRPMQIEVDALESGYNEAHAPIPLLIGTRGWGLFVASRRAGLFDVARKDPAAVEATFAASPAAGDGLEFHLLSAEPIDVTKLYYDVAGYPKLPAPWALGPMMWRNENTNQAQIEDDAAQLRSRHLAASGYWFDRPYATGVNTFDFDPAKFTDAGAAIETLQAAGLRVAVWHTPYVAASGREASPTLNAEAESHGYFPPQVGLLLNSWGSPIDFTNADATAWWQSLIGGYTALGIEGFKLDFAEDVQVGISGIRDPWKFSDGSDERTGQSSYPLLYHSTYSQMLPSAGGFLLCRTGRWGDQVNGCIIWPGDLESDFSHERDAKADGSLSVGGLPAAFVKGLGLGASGLPFYASDTGGFRNSPGNAALCPGQSGPCTAAAELFVRWAEMSSVGTAMEVGNGASFMPWEFSNANGLDDAALATYQRYASLAMRLFPYKWTFAQHLAHDGRAIQRPIGLAYPHMTNAPTDEALLGDVILAAPVLARGQTTRAVQLPDGDWIGWWDGQRYSGAITVDAPLDTLPLFLQAGGIVPMLRPEIDTLAPATQAGVESYANDSGILFVRVAPSPTASTFTVFDGTQLSQQLAGDGQHLGFTPSVSGVFAEGVIFEVIATAQPTSVVNGGASLTRLASVDALRARDGWFWESATGGTLWVRASHGPVTLVAR
ncbi:MAG: glycoside hydrolase family 31 protein [Deltaproteobacteria bacterium]|nr:glycoside hydrolase family 31 protein [Deltaproteobacteria bacterium]